MLPEMVRVKDFCAGKELRRLQREGKVRIPEVEVWIGIEWGVRDSRRSGPLEGKPQKQRQEATGLT